MLEKRKIAIAIWPKAPKVEIFCLPNMGCGYSKVVSPDAGQHTKGFSLSSYRHAEKTLKNCSNARFSNTWLNEAIFGCFLSLAITWRTNSFCMLTSIKRYKFRLPTTHIGKTKNSTFQAFGQFSRSNFTMKMAIFNFFVFWICLFSAIQIKILVSNISIL